MAIERSVGIPGAMGASVYSIRPDKLARNLSLILAVFVCALIGYIVFDIFQDIEKLRSEAPVFIYLGYAGIIIIAFFLYKSLTYSLTQTLIILKQDCLIIKRVPVPYLTGAKIVQPFEVNDFEIKEVQYNSGTSDSERKYITRYFLNVNMKDGRTMKLVRCDERKEAEQIGEEIAAFYSLEKPNFEPEDFELEEE